MRCSLIFFAVCGVQGPPMSPSLRVGCVAHILLVNIQVKKECTTITCPVVCAWVINSFHNCHFYAVRLESLRLSHAGNTRRIFKMTAMTLWLYFHFICTFFSLILIFFFRNSQSQPRVDTTVETFFLPFFHVIFKVVP